MYKVTSFAALFLFGCQETNFFIEKDEPYIPQAGSIEGRVCDPSGLTWLSDAEIYTYLRDPDGHVYDSKTVYSDRDGYWLIDDLPQSYYYDIFVQFRSDIIETHTDIYVTDGERVILEEPDCFDPLEVNVAVVAGDYDDFQLVLSNMGFANYDLVDGLSFVDLRSFLSDPAALEPYDIIFFNGGHVEEDIIYDTDETNTEQVQQVRDTILSYVQAGGTIYASDWAYDVIETIWPEKVNFVGDDEIPDAAQLGEYDIVQAAVSDSALATFLDKTYVDIEFDLPVWPVVENTAGSVSTHLSANVDYREGTNQFTLAASPILLSFSSGEGKVVFASFRVAKNATTDMMMSLQYMMYNL